MPTQISPQPYNDNEVKQVELLKETNLRYLESQDQQYKDLSTKITFLFGFTATIMTLYGTYSTNVNSRVRYVTMLLFGVTLIVLCIAYKNRQFHRPKRLDSKNYLTNSSYGMRVHKYAENVTRACNDNILSLERMGKWVRWSIWIFTIALISLIFSFIVPHTSMINSVHAQHSAHKHTAPRPDRG